VCSGCLDLLKVICSARSTCSQRYISSFICNATLATLVAKTIHIYLFRVFCFVLICRYKTDKFKNEPVMSKMFINLIQRLLFISDCKYNEADVFRCSSNFFLLRKGHSK
jgi:hypothetical protein